MGTFITNIYKDPAIPSQLLSIITTSFRTKVHKKDNQEKVVYKYRVLNGTTGKYSTRYLFKDTAKNVTLEEFGKLYLSQDKKFRQLHKEEYQIYLKWLEKKSK